MILSDNPKRLVIFLFYDKDGIVDSYIPYMLSDIKKNVNEIFVVANGKVNDEGKEKLKGIADTVWCRKNEGFDVWGYKEAIEEIGWDKLYEFDEVILMNYTIMGPVYPFKEMFDSMAKRDLDFWGITKFHQADFDPFGTIECGFIHEHLQSHFIAVRNKMLTSKEFKDYWEEMPMIYSYNESVGFHESKFTFTFEDYGYTWEPYVDTSDYEGKTYCPIITYPKEIIVEKRCPIFKRRSFMHDYADLLNFTCGEPGYELMKYLKEHTDYDTDMIWENLLRCYDMNTIKDNLQLNYILPERSFTKKQPEELYKDIKIALIFHAYFEDLIDSTEKYINSMPPQADIYITTNTPEKKKLFEDRFKNNKFNKLEVIQIENRGRDVSALLVASKEFIMDYDYVCFAHDKKVGQLKMGSVGASFAYHCLENILPTQEFVNNVVETFENNPRLGLLTPMPPIHGEFYPILGNEWSINFTITKSIASQLDLNVPMSQNVPPVTPLGTMFWFRPKGMKKLFDKDWKYNDFPKEPNDTDGTILHAIERIYGFVEQDAGYYCAWLFSDKCAAMTTTNMSFMLSGYNKSLKKLGICGTYDMNINDVRNRFSAITYLKDAGEYFGRAYPQLFAPAKSRMIIRLYIDDGSGFSEKNSVIGVYKLVENKLTCTFKIPIRYRKNIKKLRFDPGEEGFISLNNLKIKMLDKEKEESIVNNKLTVTNAIKSKDMFVFLCDDPQIIWNVDENSSITEIKIKSEINSGVNKSEFLAMTGNNGILPHAKIIGKDSFVKRVLRKLYHMIVRRKEG